jgi:hypothetical protein
VVEPGYGDLTINQGQGFKPVTSGTNANVGDAVIDGWKVNVRPGAVTTISPLSPCASGSNAANDDTWGWIIAATLFGIGIGVAAYEASKSNGTTTPVTPASP